MAQRAGLTIQKEDDSSCYLIWSDSFVASDVITSLKDYQKINHFPGMGEICRKDCLARNMRRASRYLENDYNFVPKTWILPSEYSELQSYYKDLKRRSKKKTFILKPSNGAMGNGFGFSFKFSRIQVSLFRIPFRIILYRNAEKIAQSEQTVVQEYLEKPLLLEGFKCDMRIYVLMTSCDPLKLFLFDDGLIRMSTEKYTPPNEGNIEKLFMHLTNYSVNKHSENYEKSGKIDTGSKRTLQYFREYIRKRDIDDKLLWRHIIDLIIKTMIVAHPHVLHAYRMCRPGVSTGKDSVCFEILGFDIMLDKKLKPWLLEINRSPSFGTDEQLDYDIKSTLLYDTFKLLNIRASDKRRNMAEQKAQAQKRLFQGRVKKELDITDIQKKKISLSKKKDELKDLLQKVKKDAARDYYETQNCGGFQKIFPPPDRHARERYAKLMSEVHKISMEGLGKASGAFSQEILRTYNNPLKEEDILDLLAQCEADEKLTDKNLSKNKFSHDLRHSRGFPGFKKSTEEFDEDSDDDYDHDDPDGGEDCESDNMEEPFAFRNGTRRSRSECSTQRRKLSRPSSKTHKIGRTTSEERFGCQAKQEEENLKRTLSALNDMRIKFPGKTDEEAEFILDKMNENWKFHKPRIASYWLVKLDSIKRRKVLDIVRSNVKALLVKVWKSADIENIRINRIFSRVFNRLLWSHGQGLWNCFQAASQSWETIFSKSSDVITPIEMLCCRRVVQLCRDCLLIVYQFASESKTASKNSPSPDPVSK
ncbi:DgyrCDS1059 [Dimorphilus gyrociliatus]|nr:DgyrCDS1059 [Dimorphilus gyrociliatus]